MSDSWDEKYEREKDKAKEAFDRAAPDQALAEPDLSPTMREALAGLNDRREGAADRRQHDIHAEARKPRTMGGRTAFEILKGEHADEREKDDKPPEKERPAPRPPSFGLGAQSQPRTAPNDELERERKRERTREDDSSREAFARALLRESREHDRGRDR